MAAKQSSLVFCFAFIVITSNCASFVCASINATIIVSIEPSEENLNLTTAVVKSGDISFNVSSRASFFIIQAHSLNAGLVLSNDQNFANVSTAVGFSLGLVQMVNTTTDVYTFYLAGPNATSVLISIQGYDDKAPVPGGCNMVLDPKDVPYQIIGITDEMIETFVQPASAPGRSCEEAFVKLEMYHYYFGTYYYEEAGYYDSVANMMTVEGIMKYGKKVGESTSISPLRRYYNNYKGRGVVFGVIARYTNASSAYVPVATFGCNQLLGETTCDVYYYPPLAVILTTLGILAVFYERSLTLWSNIVILSIVTIYIMATQIPVDPSYIVLPMAGVFVVIFFIFRRYKLDQFINAPLVGYLLGDWILFGYFLGTDSTLMHSLIFVTGAFLFFPFKRATSLFTSFVYLTTGLSIFFGGVLYYVFVIDFRRLFVPNFNLATIDPPNETADNVALTIAACITICVYNFQFLCKRRNLATADAETTPLLA